MSHSAKILLTVIFAILAALIVSLVLFLYLRLEGGASTAPAESANSAEEQTLQTITPPPGSDAVVAQHSTTLSAVSKSSQFASVSEQDKLSVLGSMH